MVFENSNSCQPNHLRLQITLKKNLQINNSTARRTWTKRTLSNEHTTSPESGKACRVHNNDKFIRTTHTDFTATNNNNNNNVACWHIVCSTTAFSANNTFHWLRHQGFIIHRQLQWKGAEFHQCQQPEPNEYRLIPLPWTPSYFVQYKCNPQDNSTVLYFFITSLCTLR